MSDVTPRPVGSGSINNPDIGTLSDGEMIRFDTTSGKMEGSGDINTDSVVNFGTKTVQSGTGTFRLGEAVDMSSGGENVIFTNLADNNRFNPVWVNQQTNQAFTRITVGTLQELIQEASKADILINPSWTSNPVVDWRVVTLTVESDTTITNAIFNVTKNGNDFYRAEMGTITANVETVVDLTTVGNVPVDAFQVGTYIVSVTSQDGDVRLKGSTANSLPFFKVGYFEFEDRLSLTENEYSQRQLIRSGVKGNYTATSVTGDTQIRVEADDASGFTELYFNLDSTPDNFNGTTFQMPDTNVSIPNDPLSKDYFLSIDNAGTFAITTAKTSVSDLTTISLCIFTAQNGFIEPTTLSNEPYVSWTDHSQAGVLEKRKAEVLGLIIASQNNATMGIKSSAYSVIADGINYDTNKVDPHTLGAALKPIMNWTYAIRNFNAPPAIGSSVLLDGDQWDNNGTLETVPAAGMATVQSVYWVRKNQFVILFGQQLFANYDDAILNYLNVDFILPAQSDQWEEVARIVMKDGATDSNDKSEVFIFDISVSSQGSGSVSNGDVVGAASSTANEVVTYSNTTGKALSDTSDITMNAGVIKRILASNHIAMDNKFSVNTTEAPRGIIQANEKAGDTDSYGGDINCPLVGNVTVDNGGNTPTGKQPGLTILRTGVSAQAFGNVFEIGISRYENVGNNSRTKIDFLMSHGAGSVEGDNIPLFMSMYSSGQLETPTTASWTIGGTRDLANYKLAIKGLGALGFPEVTTVQKVALTGLRNNAVVYDTTLGRFEKHVGSNVWENLSDITKPASATVNEVPTYTNVAGDELSASSDVTINNGVIGRITGGQHIAIEDKLAVNTAIAPRGVIQANAKPNATSSYTSDLDCPIVANLVTNNGGNTPAPALPAFVMVRPGVTNDSFGNIVEAMLSRYENVSFNARTKLEWRMAHGDGNTEDNNIPSFMSWYSSGQLDTPANSHWTIGGVRDTGQYALSLKGLGAFGAPEMTTVQKTALTGLRTNAIVYDTTLSRFEKHLGVGVWGPLVPAIPAYTIDFKFNGALVDGTSILTANRLTPKRYFGQRLQIVRVEVYSRIGSDNTALLTMKSGGVDITSVNLNARSGLFTNGALPGDRFIEDGDILELDYNALLSVQQGTDIEVYLEVQPI